jgi:hypothetical protein
MLTSEPYDFVHHTGSSCRQQLLTLAPGIVFAAEELQQKALERYNGVVVSNYTVVVIIMLCNKPYMSHMRSSGPIKLEQL